jgi:hypothetical protein
MINALEQAQEALHVEAPLVQDVISIAGLCEAHDPRGAVDLGVDCLGGDELADVLFRLVLGQVEQLGQAVHADAGVVLCDDADVVFNDALAQVLPPVVGLGIGRLAWGGVEDISGEQMRSEYAGDFRPAHELVDSEEAEKLGVLGHQGVAGVLVNAVEQVVLLVVVWGENDEVDDPLENLGIWLERKRQLCRDEADRHTKRNCSGLFSIASVSSTCR